jgi:hypothetical protein
MRTKCNIKAKDMPLKFPNLNRGAHQVMAHFLYNHAISDFVGYEL